MHKTVAVPPWLESVIRHGNRSNPAIQMTLIASRPVTVSSIAVGCPSWVNSPGETIRSTKVTRQSRRKWLPVWIALALSSVILANVNAEETVSWDTVYNPRAGELTVRILATLPLKDVYCEIILVNNVDKVVDKRTLVIVNGKKEILPSNRSTVRVFALDTKGATVSDSSLLYATPILSSPKAAGSRFIKGLRRGMPAWGHQAL